MKWQSTPDTVCGSDCCLCCLGARGRRGSKWRLVRCRQTRTCALFEWFIVCVLCVVRRVLFRVWARWRRLESWYRNWARVALLLGGWRHRSIGAGVNFCSSHSISTAFIGIFWMQYSMIDKYQIEWPRIDFFCLVLIKSHLFCNYEFTDTAAGDRQPQFLIEYGISS